MRSGSAAVVDRKGTHAFEACVDSATVRIIKGFSFSKSNATRLTLLAPSLRFLASFSLASFCFASSLASSLALRSRALRSFRSADSRSYRCCCWLYASTAADLAA